MRGRAAEVEGRFCSVLCHDWLKVEMLSFMGLTCSNWICFIRTLTGAESGIRISSSPLLAKGAICD